MSLTLAELKVGERAKIVGFTAAPIACQNRLLALGLAPETQFEVVRMAPLGDPIEVKVHQSSLCLRREEVTKILQLERV